MNYYTELTNRGVLALTGPDSRTFLQGQTTCDFDTLTETNAISGAYCTPQGRMVCDFRAIALNDTDCLLSMHDGICENAASVFGKYIVFSKSDIAHASSDWAAFAVWSDAEPINIEMGKDDLGAYWSAVDESGTRFECHCPVQAKEQVQAKLSALAERVEQDQWQLMEINAGQGHLEPETVDMFIPQMLNYQATGHISFTKGCYTGQEVVARMHYRGKLKRPMHIISADVPAPEAGTPLFVAGSEQSVGNVVNAVSHDDGMSALAVCTLDAAEGEVLLASSSGALVTFHTLPYALEEEN